MQIRLTVLGPRSGRAARACDVLITAPASTPLSAVAGALAASAGSGQPPRSSGSPVALYAGAERLDPAAPLGLPPLVDGAVLSLHAPDGHHPEPRPGSPAAARLHVVGGPDAGGVHLLQGGRVRIGRSADADVPLDDPDVSRLHCTVTVTEDGRVTVADPGSTNGTTLDGRPVGDRPVPFEAGALLRVGESTLRLEPAPAGSPVPPPPAAVPAVPDAEGHLRVTVPAATVPAPRQAHAPMAPEDGGQPRVPDGEQGVAGTIGAWARRLTAGRPGVAGAVRGADSTRLAAEAAALRERWPDPAAVLLTALGPGRRLWERGPGHPDALTVRLGTADLPAEDGIGTLPAVPFTVDLLNPHTFALGLAGPRPRLAGLARAVLAQLCALHSPATLELVLISADRGRPAEQRADEWAWLNWLPHLRPAHGQDCRLLLALDREQAEARVAELARRLDEGPLGPGWAGASPQVVAGAAVRREGPYTLLVVDGDPGSGRLREAVGKMAAAGPSAGVHVLCLAESPDLLAADCGAVALLTGDVATTLRMEPGGYAGQPPSASSAITEATVSGTGPLFGEGGRGGRGGRAARPWTAPSGLTPGGTHTGLPRVAEAALRGGGPQHAGPAGAGEDTGTEQIIVDAVSAAWAERFARALAPLRETEASMPRPRSALPRTTRLLDELELALATPAKISARWKDTEGHPGGVAVVVLGAGPEGRIVVDLAAEGPHLMAGGAPGSGKTELLRSVASALAAAERPDRLALVLVDGAGEERGAGLRSCTDLPHVATYLAAGDPGRMREFAQALTAELKRREEVLGGHGFAQWHTDRLVTVPRQSVRADVRKPSEQGAVKVQTRGPGVLPRLVVVVDDFDALVAPGLGNPGRPAAGSVVRALEAVARDGERLGVHLVASTGRPERTAGSEADERAPLRIALRTEDPESAALLVHVEDPAGLDDALPGRGYLRRPGGAVTPFQVGRVSGRIPRTATLRPTVVPLEWERMGDPPTRRPLRELGNGPTDLALLASALQRAAESAGAGPARPLL